MRPQKVNDQELLQGLTSVLRAKGYDGASLNELASSSGLNKASLYYRYPGGKKDIVLAVLIFIGQWIDKNILSVLCDGEVPALERLSVALTNIDTLYNSGKSNCIVRAISMDNGMNLFGDQLKETITKWLDSFCKLGVDVGMDEETANKKAIQILGQIEGSLVVSKILNDTLPFQLALKEVEMIYKE